MMPNIGPKREEGRILKKDKTNHSDAKGRVYPRTLPEYKIWRQIRQMCNNPKSNKYYLYGGRGIGVCKEWNDYEAFLSDMGERPTNKHSVERIDNNEGFYPWNCKWATTHEQNRNKRTNVKYNGECAVDASIRLGGHKALILERVAAGWSIKKAFTEPVNIVKRSKIEKEEI